VDTVKPLSAGTKVRIKIFHRSENFEGLGRVVYARQNEGMGIHFTNIEPNDQLVLDISGSLSEETRANKVRVKRFKS
jgi:hypothetical protein